MHDVTGHAGGCEPRRAPCLEPPEGRGRPDRPSGPLARARDPRLGARRLGWEGRASILDSGVETGHPLVGELESAVVISIGENDEVLAEEDVEGDVSGHGTACAGIVRSLAPECDISSVRVLGSTFTGSGAVLLGGSATRSSRVST